MDNLVKMVMDKAGIAEESAKAAVDTVVGFIKEKIGEPLASQIDNIVNMLDENKDGNVADDLMKKASGLLGGLFGGEKK
jgi:hypothetical protein